jgi:hypothetical protein
MVKPAVARRQSSIGRIPAVARLLRFLRYHSWPVIALLAVAIAGAAGGIWALRNGNPTGWFQDLLPELIGFLLGSIATYLIIDRLIESRRRRTWRAVEGRLLYDQVMYAARVVDALTQRYGQPSSNATFIGLAESSRDEDEPAGAIDVDRVQNMLEQSQELIEFAEAAQLVIKSHEQAIKSKSFKYFLAVETLKGLLKYNFDEELPHLRHILESAPNVDLMVRIAEEPTIARRTLEAQTAVTDLYEQLFFGKDEPLTSAQMNQVCRALQEGTETAEDLAILEALYLELGVAVGAASAVSRLALVIGKHRSSWSRDKRWRKVREQR